ncbi:MAG TPA: hypothetical protein VL981_00835 [Candidatus Methylacidiphilales bacterium]|nr:hypothetical protein [Candidatus Methylacidiphilales bacterium]
MALSPQDQDYYEQKLGVKGYIPFFGATLLIGAISVPLLLFLMDWSSGSTSQWNAHVVGNLIAMGCMLGSIVSIVMNLIFRFLLWMGWLPSRR